MLMTDMSWLCLQLTGGISKGLAMLTLDQDYISRFRNQPMTYQQRLIYALQALGVGLYEGVIGALPLPCMQNCFAGTTGLACAVCACVYLVLQSPRQRSSKVEVLTC